MIAWDVYKRQPIFSAWLNGHIDDNSRATVLSINGQMNSLGQILGGPIIGIIATNISVSIGIVCTLSLIHICSFFFYVKKCWDECIEFRYYSIDLKKCKLMCKYR